MFVSCPAARFHATSRTMCIYVYLCVCLHVRDMYAAARALPGSAALPGTTCMRLREHFQSFTHYMHAAARALSLFHSQGSAAAPGHVGGDGLPDCTRVGVCWSLFEFVLRSSLLEFALSRAVRVLRNRVNRVSRCVGRCASRCVNFSQPHALTRHARGGAGGAGFSLCSICRWWRWRPGRVGVELARRWRSGLPGRGALVALSSWPVAVRRRALGAMLQCSTSACHSCRCSWRGVARRGAWRGECRLWVPRA